MSKATIVCVLLMAACATGGESGNEPADAAVTRVDANNVVTPDAWVRLDSGVGADAQVSQLPDAGTGSGSGSGGLFCTANSNCTVAGECCVTLGGPQGFCAPGVVVLGQCVPQ
jgi:hypothetical protein